jgi:L-histidine N-alpha-methyltransferase
METTRYPTTDGRAVASREREAFLRDVREDLQKTPRRLRPQYLYDDLGSSLFEAICRLPWYPITRVEKRLLAAQREAIVRRTGDPLTLIELGCGTGEKLELLVEAFLAHHCEIAVQLIDVSAMALEHSRRTLAAGGRVEVTCYETTYEAGLSQAAHAWNDRDRRLVLFLGSNIGNFEPQEATQFLVRVREALAAGDHLLVGVDLVKPAAVLEAAYDDPLGVTAAFNKNLLVRMNREFGADFDLAAFAHRACWNPQPSRVEMHLVGLRDQVVRIPGACTLSLDAGETIWTESSYKYTPERLESMVGEASFEIEDLWIDRDAAFALTLVRAV